MQYKCLFEVIIVTPDNLNMEEREANRFSWTIFFIVTGVSFLLFSLLMYILDIPHISVFLKTGFISTGIAVITSLVEWLSSRMPAERRTPQKDIF